MFNNYLNKFDYDKICRTCLKCNDNMTSIMDTEVLNMLTACTSLMINSDDGLPNQICTPCFSKTCELFEFRQQCANSDHLLRQVLLDDTKFPVDDIKIDDTVKLEQNGDEKNDFHDNDDEVQENDVEIHSDNENYSDDDVFDDVNATNKGTNKESSAREKALSWGLDKCDPDTSTCKICNKVLVNIHSLVRHMEMHNKNRKFHVVCKICNKGFYETGHLTKHMLRHKGEARYKCEKCSKMFYELSALGVHMKRRHKVKPVTCTECNKSFMVQLQLDIHMKSHGDQNKYICSECGKAFHQANILRKHLVKHTKERSFHCTQSQCDKSFKDKYALNTHLKYSHSGEKKREVCNICGKSVIHLQSHLFVHSETRVKCTECSKEFTSKYCLNSHIKKKHGNPDEQRRKPYLCSTCGYTSESKAALKIHAQHKHTTERAHKCPICNKSFKTSKVVTYHIRYTHNNERRFRCTQCTKSFQTSTTLKIHMRTHTGERPFECKLCGKTFGQGSTLKTHMKVHGFQFDQKLTNKILETTVEEIVEMETMKNEEGVDQKYLISL